MTLPDDRRIAASWSGEWPFTPGSRTPVRYRAGPFTRIQPDHPWALWGWTRMFLIMRAGTTAAAVLSFAIAAWLARRDATTSAGQSRDVG